MSIFDNMDPGQIAEAIDRQFGQGTAQGVMGAQQQQPPTIPGIEGIADGRTDVSGFANVGMTPPPLSPLPGLQDASQPAALSNPMAQIGGLMGMMSDPNQQRQGPMPQQQGALMAYLQSLGV